MGRSFPEHLRLTVEDARLTGQQAEQPRQQGMAGGQVQVRGQGEKIGAGNIRTD
jgi:hypothetical protein